MRIISILTIIFFLFTGIGNSYPYATGLPVDISGLNIPSKYGIVVEKKIFPNSDSIVVYIEDAHGNYTVQKNIGAILDILNKKYGVKNIFVEGSEGEIDVSLYKAYPLKDVKRKVMDKVLREGKVSGAEAYAIISDDDIRLTGVENNKLYIKQVKTYGEIAGLKGRAEELSDKLKNIKKSMIDTLHPYEREYLLKKRAFGNKELNLLEYVEYLLAFSKGTGIDSGCYKSLRKVQELAFYGKNIKLSEVENETEELIGELVEAGLGDDELILLARIKKDAGLVKGNAAYYNKLHLLAADYGIDIRKYENLNLYMYYLWMLGDRAGEEILDELKSLEKRIEKKGIEHRDIVRKIFKADIYEKLLKLNITSDEIKRIKNDKSFDFCEDDREVIQLFFRFYGEASKREKAILRRITGVRNNIKVLITGGYHTCGISDEFKCKKISYLIVKPYVESFESGVNLYKNIMKERVEAFGVDEGTRGGSLQIVSGIADYGDGIGSGVKKELRDEICGKFVEELMGLENKEELVKKWNFGVKNAYLFNEGDFLYVLDKSEFIAAMEDKNVDKIVSLLKDALLGDIYFKMSPVFSKKDVEDIIDVGNFLRSYESDELKVCNINEENIPGVKGYSLCFYCKVNDLINFNNEGKDVVHCYKVGKFHANNTIMLDNNEMILLESDRVADNFVVMGGEIDCYNVNIVLNANIDGKEYVYVARVGAHHAEEWLNNLLSHMEYKDAKINSVNVFINSESSYKKDLKLYGSKVGFKYTVFCSQSRYPIRVNKKWIFFQDVGKNIIVLNKKIKLSSGEITNMFLNGGYFLKSKFSLKPSYNEFNILVKDAVMRILGECVLQDGSIVIDEDTVEDIEKNILNSLTYKLLLSDFMNGYIESLISFRGVHYNVFRVGYYVGWQKILLILLSPYVLKSVSEKFSSLNRYNSLGAFYFGLSAVSRGIWLPNIDGKDGTFDEKKFIMEKIKIISDSVSDIFNDEVLEFISDIVNMIASKEDAFIKRDDDILIENGDLCLFPMTQRDFINYGKIAGCCSLVLDNYFRKNPSTYFVANYFLKGIYLDRIIDNFVNVFDEGNSDIIMFIREVNAMSIDIELKSGIFDFVFECYNACDDFRACSYSYGLKKDSSFVLSDKNSFLYKFFGIVKSISNLSVKDGKNVLNVIRNNFFKDPEIINYFFSCLNYIKMLAIIIKDERVIHAFLQYDFPDISKYINEYSAIKFEDKTSGGEYEYDFLRDKYIETYIIKWINILRGDSEKLFYNKKFISLISKYGPDDMDFLIKYFGSGIITLLDKGDSFINVALRLCYNPNVYEKHIFKNIFNIPFFTDKYDIDPSVLESWREAILKLDSELGINSIVFFDVLFNSVSYDFWNNFIKEPSDLNPDFNGSFGKYIVDSLAVISGGKVIDTLMVYKLLEVIAKNKGLITEYGYEPLLGFIKNCLAKGVNIDITMRVAYVIVPYVLPYVKSRSDLDKMLTYIIDFAVAVSKLRESKSRQDLLIDILDAGRFKSRNDFNYRHDRSALNILYNILKACDSKEKKSAVIRFFLMNISNNFSFKLKTDDLYLNDKNSVLSIFLNSKFVRDGTFFNYYGIISTIFRFAESKNELIRIIKNFNSNEVFKLQLLRIVLDESYNYKLRWFALIKNFSLDFDIDSFDWINIDILKKYLNVAKYSFDNYGFLPDIASMSYTVNRIRDISFIDNEKDRLRAKFLPYMFSFEKSAELLNEFQKFNDKFKFTKCISVNLDELLGGRKIVKVYPKNNGSRTVRFMVEGDNMVYNIKYIKIPNNDLSSKLNELINKIKILKAIDNDVLPVNGYVPELVEYNGHFLFELNIDSVKNLLPDEEVMNLKKIICVIYRAPQESFDYVTKDFSNDYKGKHIRKKALEHGLINGFFTVMSMWEKWVFRDEAIFHRNTSFDWYNVYIQYMSCNNIGSMLLEQLFEWIKYPNLSIIGLRDYGHYVLGEDIGEDSGKKQYKQYIGLIGNYIVYFLIISATSFLNNGFSKSDYRKFLADFFSVFGLSPYDGMADELFERVREIKYTDSIRKFNEKVHGRGILGTRGISLKEPTWTLIANTSLYIMDRILCMDMDKIYDGMNSKINAGAYYRRIVRHISMYGKTNDKEFIEKADREIRFILTDDSCDNRYDEVDKLLIADTVIRKLRVSIKNGNIRKVHSYLRLVNSFVSCLSGAAIITSNENYVDTIFSAFSIDSEILEEDLFNIVEEIITKPFLGNRVKLVEKLLAVIDSMDEVEYAQKLFRHFFLTCSPEKERVYFELKKDIFSFILKLFGKSSNIDMKQFYAKFIFEMVRTSPDLGYNYFNEIYRGFMRESVNMSLNNLGDVGNEPSLINSFADILTILSKEYIDDNTFDLPEYRKVQLYYLAAEDFPFDMKRIEPRILGRTLYFEWENGYYAIKFMKRSETASKLDRELRIMEYIGKNSEKFGMSGAIPEAVRIDGHTVCSTDISSVPANIRRKFKNMENKESFNIDRVDGKYKFIIYKVGKEDYFKYLNEAENEEEFVKAAKRNLHDLAILARYSIIHAGIIKTFRNFEDGREYQWSCDSLCGLDRGEFFKSRIGSIHAWKSFIRYPDMRLSGIADFAEIFDFDKIDINMNLGPLAHNYVGDKRKVFINYIRNYLFSVFLTYFNFLDGHGELNSESWNNEKIVARVAGILRDLYSYFYEEYTGGSTIYLNDIKDIVNWEQFARQGLFYMSDAYKKSLAERKIPRSIYGEKLHVNFVDNVYYQREWGYISPRDIRKIITDDKLFVYMEDKYFRRVAGNSTNTYRLVLKPEYSDILKFLRYDRKFSEKTRRKLLQFFKKKKDGWRKGEVNDDLGGVNGPFPVTELGKALYVYSSFMFFEKYGTVSTYNDKYDFMAKILAAILIKDFDIDKKDALKAFIKSVICSDYYLDEILKSAIIKSYGKIVNDGTFSTVILTKNVADRLLELANMNRKYKEAVRRIYSAEYAGIGNVIICGNSYEGTYDIMKYEALFGTGVKYINVSLNKEIFISEVRKCDKILFFFEPSGFSSYVMSIVRDSAVSFKMVELSINKGDFVEKIFFGLVSDIVEKCTKLYAANLYKKSA